MKVIMVPVADRPECRIALDAAFRLAMELTANIVGYHLRPHLEEHQAHGARLRLSLQDGAIPELSGSSARLNSGQGQRLFREMA